MAMRRSLAPLLILSVIPTALAGSPPEAAASPTGAAGDGGIEKACKGTQFVATCVDMLKANPESKAASPRRLAELAFAYLVKEGPALSAEAKRAMAAAKNPETLSCLTTLDGEVGGYFSPLAKLGALQSDANKFREVKYKLTQMLSIPPGSGAMCSEVAISSEPVIKKMWKYEDLVQVTLDLMDGAAKADSSLAEPPATEEDHAEH
ncbi:hypothetical protein ACP70R_023339 [Stipagrostis hirtigluma subsp. patula]